MSYVIQNRAGNFYNTSTRKFHTAESRDFQVFKTQPGAWRALKKVGEPADVVDVIVITKCTHDGRCDASCLKNI